MHVHVCAVIIIAYGLWQSSNGLQMHGSCNTLTLLFALDVQFTAMLLWIDNYLLHTCPGMPSNEIQIRLGRYAI